MVLKRRYWWITRNRFALFWKAIAEPEVEAFFASESKT